MKGIVKNLLFFIENVRISGCIKIEINNLDQIRLYLNQALFELFRINICSLILFSVLLNQDEDEWYNL